MPARFRRIIYQQVQVSSFEIYQSRSCPKLPAADQFFALKISESRDCKVKTIFPRSVGLVLVGANRLQWTKLREIFGLYFIPL